MPVYEQYVELIDQDRQPVTYQAASRAEVGRPHLAYAVQWFAFGVIAVGGWVALLRREHKDERADEEVAA